MLQAVLHSCLCYILRAFVVSCFRRQADNNQSMQQGEAESRYHIKMACFIKDEVAWQVVAGTYGQDDGHIKFIYPVPCSFSASIR